jgi:hypothetical protein
VVSRSLNASTYLIKVGEIMAFSRKPRRDFAIYSSERSAQTMYRSHVYVVLDKCRHASKPQCEPDEQDDRIGKLATR